MTATRLTDSEAQELLLAERQRLERSRVTLGRERPGDAREADTQDVNETGVEIEERQEEAMLIEATDADLAEVDAALARLRDGTYGVCEHCHRRINEERLRVLSATRTCTEHAS